jgi:hypothetical protein
MRSLIVAVALSAAAASPVAAQSLTGAWDGSMNTPGGARPVQFVLQQDGTKLTGTVKRPTGDVPLEGTVNGNAVRFAYSIQYGGNPITMTVITTLAGETMTGQVDIAGQVQEAFSAKRAAPATPTRAAPGAPQ